jgi:hypothetical protein
VGHPAHVDAVDVLHVVIASTDVEVKVWDLTGISLRFETVTCESYANICRGLSIQRTKTMCRKQLWEVVVKVGFHHCRHMARVVKAIASDVDIKLPRRQRQWQRIGN